MGEGGAGAGTGEKRALLAGWATAQREALSYCPWDSKQKSSWNSCYQTLPFRVSASPHLSKAPFFLLRGKQSCVRQGISLERKTCPWLGSIHSHSDRILPPVFVLYKEVCFLLLFIKNGCIYFFYTWRKTEGVDAPRVTCLYLTSSDGPELLSCLKNNNSESHGVYNS